MDQRLAIAALRRRHEVLRQYMTEHNPAQVVAVAALFGSVVAPTGLVTVLGFTVAFGISTLA